MRRDTGATLLGYPIVEDDELVGGEVVFGHQWKSQACVPRCDQCRFWDQSLNHPGLGECQLTCWGEDSGHDHPTSKAKAQAGGHEPGSAALETSADFGCVQFEVKK